MVRVSSPSKWVVVVQVVVSSQITCQVRSVLESLEVATALGKPVPLSCF